jgi:hypothetical protein
MFFVNYYLLAHTKENTRALVKTYKALYLSGCFVDYGNIRFQNPCRFPPYVKICGIYRWTVFFFFTI